MSCDVSLVAEDASEGASRMVEKDWGDPSTHGVYPSHAIKSPKGNGERVMVKG